MLSSEQKNELLQVFTDLIRIDSSNPPGNETGVVEYMQELLQREGIKTQVYCKDPHRPNLYAELGGGDRPPILLLSHIDVVPAPGPWKHPPFEAVNDQGVIYGRGAVDTKHLTAMHLMSMIWIHRSGMALNRKILLLATADEEGGSSYGMEFIAQEHPELLPAGYVISEGGGFVLEQNGKRLRTCTCGEKGRCGITVTAVSQSTGAGPWHTPAGRLLRAMAAIADYSPELRLTEPTRAFEKAVDGRFEDKTLRNLWEYSTKSCLAIDAYDLCFGDPEVRPQVQLSFQYIDGTTRDEITEMTQTLLGGEEVSYEIGSCSEGYTCSLDNPFFHLLSQVSEELDPQTTILPMIALGRTDGRFIRNNVYGYSPMLADLPFSEVLKMVHQCNERITEDSLYFGAEVLYRAIVQTVQAMASGRDKEELQ